VGKAPDACADFLMHSPDAGRFSQIYRVLDLRLRSIPG
jgi:hypothetical protein